MEVIVEGFKFISHLENGLDIKTAGDLVKEAIKCNSKVTILNGSRQGDAKLIFNVMSLNIRKGDELEIEVIGENEKEDAAVMEKYVRENL